MRKEQLFVIVMPIGREHVHVDFRFKDSIDQPMLFCNLTAPSILWLSLQRLRMTSTRFGMLCYFIQQSDCLFERCRLATLQFCESFFCLRRIGYGVHTQRELSQAFMSSRLVKVIPLPSAISFSALSRRAKNSSFVIKVWSSLSFTNFRKYFATRFIMASLSARIPMSRQICAFNCTVVIFSILLCFPLQIYELILIKQNKNK